jgi:hypothetical protein
MAFMAPDTIFQRLLVVLNIRRDMIERTGTRKRGY